MDVLDQEFKDKLQRQFFRPICTEHEIDRIFAPQNAMDFLLKMRADYIVDHMRIFRFYRRQALKRHLAYSLEGTFRTAHYRNYRSTLPKEDREALAGVTYGDVFTNEANGQIFNSPFGRIVTISQSLQYFLEFSHLALLDFEGKVPTHIRLRALLIALRVMFQYESFDFDVDPRGKIPTAVLKQMLRPVPLQLEFIAGHEFAHHLLGHLSEERLHRTLTDGDSDGPKAIEPVAIFSTSEQEELSADLNALMRPRISDERRASMLNGAILWFGALELYQHAQNVINPQPPWKAKSHPSARARHIHLVENVGTKYEADVREASDSVISAVEGYKKHVTEFLSFHIDEFEIYGSLYLDEPNTEWRGPKLIDRVDYY